MMSFARFHRPLLQAAQRRCFSTSGMRLDSDMFCFQCAQTEEGTGCTTVGVCGKTSETASLQDLLVDQTKRLAFVTERQSRRDPTTTFQASDLISKSLFATMTNVNFSSESIKSYVSQVNDMTNTLQRTATDKLPSGTIDGVTVELESPQNMSVEELNELGKKVGVEARKIQTGNIDVWSGREIVTYGLKGASAYLQHAKELGRNDPEVDQAITAQLDRISPFGGNESTLGDLLGTALDVGKTNFRIMEMLDEAHTTTFGHQEPTKVTCVPRPGKAILISGHDIKDTYDLLRACEGKGVDVYTHGELLPAHAYPKLKTFKCFAGHFGGPWQLQRAEFPFFPGPIILTSNCLMEPRKSYKDRVYTKHVVGFPGVKHFEGSDFSPIVDHAQKLNGFTREYCDSQKPKEFYVGFGHNTILSVADKIVEAVQSGALKHFFVIGGCDGMSEGRSYFRDLAMNVPSDSVILTLACGKYRFNDQWEKMGTIGGIPRLLDMGQCNDAFGAVKVALALSEAFQTDVNKLPISYAISWYEQKAVAVLLSLLHLGIQDIHLGPNLPAFVSPAVLDALVSKFSIKPTMDMKGDLKHFLENH